MQILKCKNCNAELSVEVGNREFVFCQFCGTKLLLDDYRSSHRIVNEAKIKQIETAKEILEKKIELYEKEKREFKPKWTAAIVVSTVITIIGIIIIAIESDNRYSVGYYLILLAMIIMGVTWFAKPQKPYELAYSMDLITDSMENGDDDENGRRIPNGVTTGKKYTVVKAILESAGFTNIQCIPLNDIIGGKNEDSIDNVKSILYNGDINKSKIKRYPLDVNIVITYHSKQ